MSGRLPAGRSPVVLHPEDGQRPAPTIAPTSCSEVRPLSKVDSEAPTEGSARRPPFGALGNVRVPPRPISKRGMPPMCLLETYCEGWGDS